MWYLKYIIIFNLLIFSFGSFSSDNLTNIFRIKEIGSDSLLGHCTGFLDEKEKRFLTAGHCFHKKGFTVISESGENILDIKLDRIGLATSKIGLLDISGAILTDTEIQILKNSFSIEIKRHRGYQIIGYPMYRRNKPITNITCKRVISDVFREKMENSMGIENLTCISPDGNSTEDSINELTYDMVKGLSGSPVFYFGKLIGVAFHFMEERDLNKKVFKIVKISEIERLVPYPFAWKYFGLDRGVFEEKKLPNKVRLDISLKLLLNKEFNGRKFLEIKDIEDFNDGKWRFSFIDGAIVDIDSSSYLSTTGKMINAIKIKLPFKKHSLNWPLEMKEEESQLGNLMAQFQRYYSGYSYFHGGCDIVAKEGKEIKSPVRGNIEGLFYTYSPTENGYFKKFVIPWGKHYGKEEARDSYFEIAVITEDGYRFEFHHVDPNNLSTAIKKKISNGGTVEVGDILGKVKSFHSKVKDLPYDHIHYNIIDPKGKRINCEWVSELVKDELNPIINNIYAIHPKTGLAHIVEDGQLLDFRPLEIIVDSKDYKNDKGYEHQPHFIEMTFKNGESSIWDFRQSLIQDNGIAPPIFNFFAEKIKSTAGDIIYTSGDYKNFIFLNRFKLNDKMTGEFFVRVKDAKGNETLFRAIIP